MRRKLVTAAALAAALAGGALATTAAAASVTPVSPAAQAELYPRSPGQTFALRWRTNFTRCAAPQSQTVVVTPGSGPSAITLLGSAAPSTANGVQRMRVRGPVRKAQSYSWKVTLTCAEGTFVSQTRGFRLMPNGPKIQGDYRLSKGFLPWSNARTLCQGRTCTARTATGGIPLLLRSRSAVSPAVYTGRGTRRLACRAANGRLIPRGARTTVTLRKLTVLDTVVVKGMTIARRMRIQGRAVRTPATGERSGLCRRQANTFDAIATRRVT